MKLVRSLVVGMMLAGGLVMTTPAEASHRHNDRCEHNDRYRSRRYDRHHDYRRYRHDYGYRPYRYEYRRPYRYDYGYDYGYDYRYRRSYPPVVSYHYHGHRRCSRSHVSVFLGF